MNPNADLPEPSGTLLRGEQVRVHLPSAPRKFYRHGWQSWSLTAWLDPSHAPPRIQTFEGRAQNEDAHYADSPKHGGSGLAAVELEDGEILLLGALGLGARVELEHDSLNGFYESGSGEWFTSRGPELQVFAQYAQELARRFGAGASEAAPRVWCSWYSLYMFINEAVLHEVADSLGNLPFDVVQIDDGWQLGIGDWEANDKFPAGMAALAERIRAGGRQAGLWLAPLAVREGTALFREHPDWVVRDEQGQPVLAGINWGGPFYGLDTTNPAVLDWLRELMLRVRSWGYDYLKLDFLYAGALHGKRYADLPREQAYRLGLETIRTALGDAYLLACGAPVLPSLGLCDGIRIGPDVAMYWINSAYTAGNTNLTAPGVQNAIRTSLNRMWLKPLVHIDPDVVYFRTRHMELTPGQRGLLRDLALICGFRATSDLPRWLKPAERAQLLEFLGPLPASEQTGHYTFKLGNRAVDYEQDMEIPSLRSWMPLKLALLMGFAKDATKLGFPALLTSTRARILSRR